MPKDSCLNATTPQLRASWKEAGTLRPSPRPQHRPPGCQPYPEPCSVPALSLAPSFPQHPISSGCLLSRACRQHRALGWLALPLPPGLVCMPRRPVTWPWHCPPPRCPSQLPPPQQDSSSHPQHSEVKVPCVLNLWAVRMSDLEHFPQVYQRPQAEGGSSCLFRAKRPSKGRTQSPCSATLHPHQPSTPSHRRIALTVFHPDLELLRSSSSAPSNEPLLGFPEKSTQHCQAEHSGHCVSHPPRAERGPDTQHTARGRRNACRRRC